MTTPLLSLKIILILPRECPVKYTPCLKVIMKKVYISISYFILIYWVNPSKRGGMDGVFQGLAGLLQGIS